MAHWYVAALAVVFAAPPKNNTEHDVELFQGNWALASWTYRGDELSDEGLFRTVKGREFTLSQYDKQLAKGTFKLDASQNPKTIDEYPTDGKGKPELGIYEFDQDRLRICMAVLGAPRPKDFTSKAGSKTSLMVWEREKK